MSSPTRRKTRNMVKNSNNPNFNEEDNKKKEEDNKKLKAKKQRARQEKNRSNLEKSRLIMEHIPDLPKELRELISTMFPTKLKTSLTRLSNESKTNTYFTIKSSREKTVFFDGQNDTVQQMIKKKENLIKKEKFKIWTEDKLAKPHEIFMRGKIIIITNILGLITDTILLKGLQFQRGRVRQSQYQMLTFTNDEEIQKITSEYKDTFLDKGISINEFKKFINKYLKEKYSPLALTSNRTTTEEMNELVEIIHKEVYEKYEEGLLAENMLNKINLHLDEKNKTIMYTMSIQKDYTGSLQNPSFKEFIWKQIEKKLNIR